MRKLALTLTAALVVGGCTSETGGVQDAAPVATKSPALPSTSLSTEAQRKPQPELHLHVDRTTQFQLLATVMADAQNAGMVKVGIATDPIKGAEGQ